MSSPTILHLTAPAKYMDSASLLQRRLTQLTPPRNSSNRKRLKVMARGPTRQTRLATRITTFPRRIDLYFSGDKARQAIWTIIAFGGGFYAGNTVSLSFGALAINDVVAAAVTAGFVELVSFIYYRARRATLMLVFTNAFKMGVIASLAADAFKLGG